MGMEIFTLGFSWRKRQILRYFFPQATVSALPKNYSITESDNLFLWGSHPLPKNAMTSKLTMRVEDGFIRSIGLGAAFTAPCSWVFDPVGIYYDATAPSMLENMLEFETVTPEHIERAKKLQEAIIGQNITKYNLDSSQELYAAKKNIQSNIDELVKKQGAIKIILVPGQIESDASIKFGGVDIFTNQELLKLVRENNPNAYVIYKPHPDEVAGLRIKSDFDRSPLFYCDYIETKMGIHHLYDMIDEIHTITSLSGFEALIRGIKVFCYGIPFYAGWGLTHDRHYCKRRTRQRSLDELIATTLIKYPKYIHPLKKHPSNPEEVIKGISLKRSAMNDYLPRMRVITHHLLAKFRFLIAKK